MKSWQKLKSGTSPIQTPRALPERMPQKASRSLSGENSTNQNVPVQIGGMQKPPPPLSLSSLPQPTPRPVIRSLPPPPIGLERRNSSSSPQKNSSGKLVPPERLSSFLFEPEAPALPSQKNASPKKVSSPAKKFSTLSRSSTSQPPATSSPLRKTNSQKCLSPKASSAFERRQQRHSTMGRPGCTAMFRSNTEMLEAAVRDALGISVCAMFSPSKKAGLSAIGIVTEDLLDVGLDQMTETRTCSETDFEYLVILFEHGPYPAQKKIVSTMLSAFGLANTLSRLARLLNANSLPANSQRLISQSGSSTQATAFAENQRRSISSLLSTVVFACQKSELSIREAKDALIAHLPELLGGLRDEDQYIQTNVVACYTVAQIEIVDALIFMSTRLMAPKTGNPSGSSMPSLCNQILYSLKGTSLNATPKLAALTSLFHAGSRFRELIPGAEEQLDLFDTVFRLAKDDKTVEVRILSLRVLSDISRRMQCPLPPGFAESLEELARREKHEGVRIAIQATLNILDLNKPKADTSRESTLKTRERYVLEAVREVVGTRCNTNQILAYLQENHSDESFTHSSIKLILRHLKDKKIIIHHPATFSVSSD